MDRLTREAAQALYRFYNALAAAYTDPQTRGEVEALRSAAEFVAANNLEGMVMRTPLTQLIDDVQQAQEAAGVTWEQVHAATRELFPDLKLPPTIGD